MFSTRRLALKSGLSFSKLLRRLHLKRRNSRDIHKPTRGSRRALSPAERLLVLDKTGGRCHICGDRIRRNEPWAADHILAFAHGGINAVENFLPAHRDCNLYRRHFGAEEFAWILKLGVWFRSEIARQNPAAIELADRFAKHHTKLVQRRAAAKD